MSHIVVLVLGDIGRSPRMQYHAVSFAQNTHVKKVTLVGYSGEDPIESVLRNDKIKVAKIKPYEMGFLRKISILHAIVKGVLLMVSIFTVLFSIGRYELIIIQNPPCLPAVFASLIVSVFNGSKIMLDWHNLGFAMFEEQLGSKHLLVRFAKFLECFVAKFASFHICVSSAMKDWLSEHFNVNATVLYDRPAAVFDRKQLTPKERHDLFMRCDLSDVKHTSDMSESKVETTIQTIRDCRETSSPLDLQYAMRSDEDRSAVIISSTSWTADEDFTILLNALLKIEVYLEETCLTSTSVLDNIDSVEKESIVSETKGKKSKIGSKLSSQNTVKSKDSPSATLADQYYSKLVVIVTGKGPMKAAFEQLVHEYTVQNKLNKRVIVKTLWLSHSDYPLIIRAAQLGVCLHTSTSGLDLPMKVYDMLGSGVPVLAVSFPTIQELVHHDENGLIFSNHDELSMQIIRLLINPTVGDDANLKDNKVISNTMSNGDEIKGRDYLGVSSLSKLQEGTNIGTWDENWNNVMPPLLGTKYLKL